MIDLARVIAIRGDKVDKLRRVERTAGQACGAARDAVFKAREDMDLYAESIKTLEVDLLTELVDTEMTSLDFTAFEGKLKAAADKAIELSEAFEEANEKLRLAEIELEEARAETREASSKLNRISELNNLIEEEKNAEDARAEDAESDAFVETMTGREGGII